jgi:hypothetical protein
MKYLIVLFKNKERKKILKKFKTFERANLYFTGITNNEVIFDKRVENGKNVAFEIGLLEKDSKEFEIYYKKDGLGRQLKIELDDPDYKITKVSDYKVEEFLFDIQTNKKISFKKFYNQYLRGGGLKFISSLNNKIIVQEDNNYNLFSLKCEPETSRFLKILSDVLYNNRRNDCVVVPETTKDHKKYLYSVLEEKGISKSTLYRRSTTYFST